jgi:hypothetical protein
LGGEVFFVPEFGYDLRGMTSIDVLVILIGVISGSGAFHLVVGVIIINYY